jgi:hypothetical protein
VGDDSCDIRRHLRLQSSDLENGEDKSSSSSTSSSLSPVVAPVIDVVVVICRHLSPAPRGPLALL